MLTQACIKHILLIARGGGEANKLSQFMEENLEINKYYIGFGIISTKNAIQLNFSCHKNVHCKTNA